MDRLNPYVLDFLAALRLAPRAHQRRPTISVGAYPFATRILNITGSMAMGFLIGGLALTRSI